MIDVIIALLAASGTSAFLLSRWTPTGVIQSAGILSRLANAPGGTTGGIAILLFASALAALIVWKGLALYIIHWVFRNEYDTGKKAFQTIMQINALPLSPFIKRKLRRSAVMQFGHAMKIKHDERLRQQGLL